MNVSSLISYIGATAAVVAILLVIVQERRLAAFRFLALGLLLMGVESVFSGLIASSTTADEIVKLLQLQLIVGALLPAIWLAFTLTYARGEARTFLREWRYVLTAMIFAPAILCILFQQSLFVPVVVDLGKGTQLLLTLTPAARALKVLSLVGWIFTLSNLEWTLQASVGTMRWRIKYMVVSVGLLAAARCYTTVNAILYGLAELPLLAVDSAALLASCILMVRSLFAQRPHCGHGLSIARHDPGVIDSACLRRVFALRRSFGQNRRLLRRRRSVSIQGFRHLCHPGRRRRRLAVRSGAPAQPPFSEPLFAAASL